MVDWACRSLHSNYPSIHQTIHPSINPSINRSMNPSINLSIHQSIKESFNQSINPFINQPTHQPINPSINPPTNQSIYLSCPQNLFKPSVTFFVLQLAHILFLDWASWAILYYFGTNWIPYLLSLAAITTVEVTQFFSFTRVLCCRGCRQCIALVARRFSGLFIAPE